jgi:peptidoglycan hydrolase-like protein with peptidoglycan-binding domain
VAVIASAGGLLAGRLIVSPREMAALSEPPEATLITVEVVRQRISDTIITRGEVAPAAQVSLGYGELVKPAEPGGFDAGIGGGVGGEGGGGAGVLTGASAHVGDEVDEGETIVEVDNRPVFLLAGVRPAVRDLKPGDSGPDVAQLQEALGRLGLYSGPVTAVFDSATDAAVARMYERAGYAPPTTDGGSGEDAEALSGAELAVSSARQAVESALDGVDTARAAVKTAKAGLAEAQAGLRQARRERADLRAARRTAEDAKRAAENTARAQWAAGGAGTGGGSGGDAAGGGTGGDGSGAGGGAGSGSGGAAVTLEQAIAAAVGAVDPGPTDSQLAAATDAIASAKRSVQAADDGIDAAQAGVTTAKKAVAAARAGEAAAVQSLARLTASKGTVLPRVEISFVPVLPAFVTSMATDVGYAIPQILATLTPSALMVRVTGLSEGEAAMLEPGGPAELTMPDGTVRSGTVGELSSQAETGEGGISMGAPGAIVDVIPDEELDFALSGVNLKVTFVAAQTATEVLGVPLGAISSNPAGDLSVIVAGEPPAPGVDPPLERVAVVTGVSGEGLVEVTPVEPGTLDAGMRVVIGG